MVSRCASSSNDPTMLPIRTSSLGSDTTGAGSGPSSGASSRSLAIPRRGAFTGSLVMPPPDSGWTLTSRLLVMAVDGSTLELVQLVAEERRGNGRPSRLTLQERLGEAFGLLIPDLRGHGRLVGIHHHVEQRRSRVCEDVAGRPFEIPGLLDPHT